MLLDIPVQWIYPRKSDGILSGTYDLADFEAALQAQTRPACVYVTSPDYLGRMADIAGLAELCHRYHAKLLVDNAHGAHLAFLPWQCHPIQLGADYCCDSAHKMLSGLTGTAYLHVRSDIDTEPERVRDAMAMFGSTSPSYLMLASLDWCNRELASPLFRKQLEEVLNRIQQLKCRFSPRYCFTDGDPMHLTIDACASNLDGQELAAHLEQHQVFVEYADRYHVVLLFSAASTDFDFETLEKLLENFVPTRVAAEEKFSLPRPETVCGIREAALAPQDDRPRGGERRAHLCGGESTLSAGCPHRPQRRTHRPGLHCSVPWIWYCGDQRGAVGGAYGTILWKCTRCRRRCTRC